ncbi:G5 domain-containing protein [Kribbella sp. NPDC056345]|uniref:G5 domain-containing protein n=1 Tax=Kribbella sp. NPDC056345 TaxID=3345789 RepID=UPI0035E3B10E
MTVAVLGFGAGCGTAESTEPAAVAGGRVITRTAPTSEPPAPKAEPTPKTPPTPKSVVPTTTRTVVEYQVIPFKKKTVTDSELPKGTKEIRTAGANGSRKLTYAVTYLGGKQTGRKLVRQEVAKQPRSQVTAVGTKVEEEVESGCDPNYSGCVPIASDVDCSGGSGNGPEYVDGPVTVTGSDIYRLDSDDDGVGCE